VIIEPVPPDEEHTTRKLVRALEAVPDPGGIPFSMIDRASQGYYHDYLSPLALPELALVAELAGLANHPSRRGTAARTEILNVRQRVIDGEFDASKAESDKWARTPEGRAAFAALTGGTIPKPRRPT
jgi:hypothetical protein